MRFRGASCCRCVCRVRASRSWRRLLLPGEHALFSSPVQVQRDVLGGLLKKVGGLRLVATSEARLLGLKMKSGAAPKTEFVLAVARASDNAHAIGTTRVTGSAVVTGVEVKDERTFVIFTVRNVPLLLLCSEEEYRHNVITW